MTKRALIYLDHAAATPMADSVRQSMEPYFTDYFYNPSATYLPAKKVRDDLEAARQTVAQCLGARSSEIIFTAGGTEANNLAIHGLMINSNAHMVTTAIEHESVLIPAQSCKTSLAPVDAQGVVNVKELINLINDQTVLVSMMYANNEVGSIQPIKEVAREMGAIRSARRKAGNKTPLYLHTDAAQAANYLDVHVARLGVDLMTINGGKIYGPKQSGVLYVKAGVRLEPLIRGGGQEQGLRSGTENVAACIGFAKALEKAVSLRPDETRRMQALQALWTKRLNKELPQVSSHGPLKKRLPNIISLMCPGKDNERLLLELEQSGILAAAGSACSASNDEPSHVLRAMGKTTDEARSSLRFSMGRSTTSEEVEATISALAKLLV